MARIRLRFVNSFVNKNRKDGRARYYFRRPGLKAVSLPGIPGSEEFMAATVLPLPVLPMRQWGAAQAELHRAPSLLSWRITLNQPHGSMTSNQILAEIDRP